MKWQNEMRQKDLEEELAAVERRRIEGKLSHEEAILARQNLISENQRKVDEMKQETQELMRRFIKSKKSYTPTTMLFAINKLFYMFGSS